MAVQSTLHADALFVDALKAAPERGVTVRVAPNYYGLEPDVCVENCDTALALAAGDWVSVGDRRNQPPPASGV